MIKIDIKSILKKFVTKTVEVKEPVVIDIDKIREEKELENISE